MTLPNAELPFGGSKMPCTRNVARPPVGVRIVTGEPTDRSCLFAKFLGTIAPVDPSVANVRCEPWIQLLLIVAATPGLTAVRLSVEPNTLSWPARTLPTAITPGARAAAAPAEIGIGEKLLSATIA